MAHVQDSPHAETAHAEDSGLAKPRESVTASSGVVLFDGRLAEIAGFKSGTVKLRFTDGGEARVALADYVRGARAAGPIRGSGGPDPATALPWHPTGQRAHRVRRLLDGYAAGRKIALDELGNRPI